MDDQQVPCRDQNCGKSCTIAAAAPQC